MSKCVKILLDFGRISVITADFGYSIHPIIHCNFFFFCYICTGNIINKADKELLFLVETNIYINSLP